jgi:hypothetical protein
LSADFGRHRLTVDTTRGEYGDDEPAADVGDEFALARRPSRASDSATGDIGAF